MEDTKKNTTPDYYFGDIKEYSLEAIETEILSENVYLDVFSGSDLRFKKNITPLNDALNLIKGLEGVSYDYRTDDYPQHQFPAGKQIGFIAQEVEAILPQVVRTDAEGYLGIDYSKFAPLFVEGMKELEKRLAVLERENAFLRERLSTLQRPSRKSKATESL